MKVGNASRLEPSTEIGMSALIIKACIVSSAIIPKVHSQQHINSKLVLFYTCPLLNVVFLNPWKMNLVVLKIGSKYGPKWRSSLLLDQLDQLAAMKPSEVELLAQATPLKITITLKITTTLKILVTLKS